MEEIYRSQFRLPYSLYESLKKSADANRRSVNAELIARLEESFGPQESAVEREYRLNQIRKKAAPGIEEILSGVSDAIRREIERQARELAANNKLKE